MNIYVSLRIKLILLFLTVTCIYTFASESFAQKVTLHFTGELLENVLKEISSQSGYNVFGDKQLLKQAQPVTIQVKDVSLEKALQQCFLHQPFTYSVSSEEKAIVIKEKTVVERARDLFSEEEKVQQQNNVTGTVIDADGNLLPGVSVTVKDRTNIGTSTDQNGNYELKVPDPDQAVLVFTMLGFIPQEVPVGPRTVIDITLEPDIAGLEEVVVVGYGTQKKGDITGAVASLPRDRLEMVPNQNISQAIQGAIPGVSVLATEAGAAPGNSNTSITVRGRNSIRASNEPLIVVDGIPYGGELRDLNPNDVESIEVLRDASAAAIYGSRGANGVILVTTKEGIPGKPRIAYDGYYSMQRFTNVPDLMDGGEFWDFKMIRNPAYITQTEQAVYESGEWVDWLDLAFRNGASTEHNLSVSGGSPNTQYYISGGLNDVKGLAINDDYLRLTTRINLDSKITDWLTIGTRSQFSYDDRSGISPQWSGDQGVFGFNPLTLPYDENGNLTIYPWPEDTYFSNPLMGTLADDNFETYQAISNNYAMVDFPFIPGLQYRINTGIRVRFLDQSTYYGRDTQQGLVNRGDASTNRTRYNSTVIENIVNYNKEFGRHSVFVTGLYSFQEDKTSGNELEAQGFPNDFLTWYAAEQAELTTPDYPYNSTALISQMLRINYTYDSRYLLTLTARRDGYSGFGADNKWALFPSAAVGWNLAGEDFFRWKHIFNELKLRASWGLNGNQAVGAYETMTRLGQNNLVAGSTTLPGYIPEQLGIDNLGWESTRTLNFGLDFSILSDRIVGDLNFYQANTSDLLLNRTISPVHGITSVTQNIGKTRNKGFELSLTSRNVSSGNFLWTTGGSLSFVKNEIVSLYGELDEAGNEIDDIANAWFIGEPIRVYYNYVWDGVWQLEEEEEAASHGTQPGFIKIRDVNNDGQITTDDRQITGQRDPKFLWGMNNTWTYKNLTLRVFIHGVHGITKLNPLLSDDVDESVRFTTMKKSWWTPDNPTNDWYMNHTDAHRQSGVTAPPYEKAGFVRIKDITFSYDLSKNLLGNLGFDRFQIYATGRNLFTFTQYGGLDPELDGQEGVPLQKEFVFGVNLGF